MPPYYNLIWLRLDGSGSSAYGLFMNLCDINRVNEDWEITCQEKFHYIPCYTNLLANKDSYNILCVQYFNENYAKFCSLIDKKVPAICNLRDQIERLKHGVNHLNSWECAPLTKRFNLTCEYTKLFPILSYDACTPAVPPKSYFSNVPSVDSLYHYSSKGWRGTSIRIYVIPSEILLKNRF